MSETCTPITIVIFGASGDLTSRKLIPALYNNFKKGRLSACANIVGFARRPYESAGFRDLLKEAVQTYSPETFDPQVWLSFAERLTYFQGNLDVPEDFPRLAAFLTKLENGAANRLYYLATAPEYYVPVVEELGAAGMAEQAEGEP